MPPKTPSICPAKTIKFIDQVPYPATFKTLRNSHRAYFDSQQCLTPLVPEQDDTAQRLARRLLSGGERQCRRILAAGKRRQRLRHRRAWRAYPPHRIRVIATHYMNLN